MPVVIAGTPFATKFHARAAIRAYLKTLPLRRPVPADAGAMLHELLQRRPDKLVEIGQRKVKHFEVWAAADVGKKLLKKSGQHKDGDVATVLLLSDGSYLDFSWRKSV